MKKENNKPELRLSSSDRDFVRLVITAILLVWSLSLLRPIIVQAATKFINPLPGTSLDKGSFAGGQLFGKNPGGEFRINGFHDGLDFGSVDHAGNDLHAVVDGKVIHSGDPGNGLGGSLGQVVVIENNGVQIIYQEFGSDIRVKTGDSVKQDQVIASRNTTHLHLGITKKDWVSAQASAFTDDGTWLDPLPILKNEVDVGAVEGSGGGGDDSDEVASTTKKKSGSGNVDDDFLVNGYGALTSKDFKEADVTTRLPTTSDLESMEEGQKRNLIEWITDYNTSNSARIMRTSRLLIMILGYLTLIFVILLAFAYAFDRVGVLEGSIVEALSFGNYRTVYTDTEAQELQRSKTGVKPMNVKNLMIISVLGITLFILVITGNIYYYAYELYSFVINISTYMNNIRPK